jgi:hypothetical protein
MDIGRLERENERMRIALENVVKHTYGYNLDGTMRRPGDGRAQMRNWLTVFAGVREALGGEADPCRL